MFCPRCGMENKLEQRFCRQCGLTLPAVRLALEGRVDEAVQKSRKGETALGWGFILMLVGLVNAGINAFLHAWQSAVFSAGFGLVIGITLITIGLTRVGSANKLLNLAGKKDEAEKLPPAQSEHAGEAALPPAPITEELRRTPVRPPSVVENTTIKLKPGQ